MSGYGREALPDVREWSGDPPGFTGVVEKPSQMFGRGREALLDEALPDFWEWLRGPPRFTGVVGSPRGFAGVVGKASQMSGSGREGLGNLREW